MQDLGWLWIVVAICVVLLGIGLAYGLRQTYRRRRELGMSAADALSNPSEARPRDARDPAYAGAKPADRAAKPRQRR